MGTERTNGMDSDLTILNERFTKNSLPSIVGYNSKGLPFIEGHSHVDLYRVFRKKIIRTSVFNNKYRSLGLNDVATALIAKGKLEDINGKNVYTTSIELQKKYVLKDAELIMNLSNVNNGQVFHLMHSIEQLTGFSIEQGMHGGQLENWQTL
jgi:DNA polymerase elongation subunit (family B)